MYHMLTSVGVGKAFDKIQYPFLIKAFSKLGIGGNAINLIKGILMIKKTFPPKIRKDAKISLLTTFIQQ